jgi:hypothetical protein
VIALSVAERPPPQEMKFPFINSTRFAAKSRFVQPPPMVVMSQ